MSFEEMLTTTCGSYSSSESDSELEDTVNITCEYCYNKTTVEEYESEEGCEHCGLGPNTPTDGIQCDCCDRSWRDDCDWDNAHGKLVWEYGLEGLADEWIMMCPECQNDENMRNIYDEEADTIASEYFENEHSEKLKKVHTSLKSACSKYIERQKNRSAMRAFKRFTKNSGYKYLKPLSFTGLYLIPERISALLV